MFFKPEKSAWQSAILSFDALSRIAETSLPLETEHAQTPYSRICVELAVSILESSTKGDIAADTDAEWTGSALERISGLFSLLSENSGLENGGQQNLCLRLYLNLTNANPELCHLFSKHHIINDVCRTMFVQFDQLSVPQDQRQDLHVLDKLVLSLGYLINLAEFSDQMRLMMMSLKTKGEKVLDTFLQLFLKRNEAAEVRVSPVLRLEGYADFSRRILRPRPRKTLSLDIYRFSSAIFALIGL